MLVYQNLRGNSPISAIELPDNPGDNYSFLHVKSAEHLGAVKQWLAESGQHILAEMTANGPPLLIVSGSGGKDGLLQALKTRGDDFKQPKAAKKMQLNDPWVWRGITSFAGQFLTLVGSLKDKNSTNSNRKALKWFAIANIMANLSNITFGQQKKEDPHQLRFLKEQINEQLGERLPADAALPGAEENRSNLRQEEDTRSFGQKAYDIGSKYSVSGGEIGLRLFGATNLSFPMSQWNQIGTALQTGSLKPIKVDNPVTYKAGLVTLLGKFVSLVSTEPDPYNPKPPSFIRKAREKLTFPLSSVIEGAGAVMMAHDQFKNKNYLGATGNTIFIGGYIIRLFAPYGEREVNMKELNAHITDCVAGMPQEEIPQCLADIVSGLRDHFKGKGPSISEMYANLATDLKKHHNIDIFAASSVRFDMGQMEPATPHPDIASTEKAAPSHREAVSHLKPRFAQESMRTPSRIERLQPQTTHQERIAANATSLSRSVG